MEQEGTESGASATKPQPRQGKSQQHQTQIAAQNRRREYLHRHPSYYNGIEHELSDPVLYERLVKRHQSAAERQSEGKAKGYGRTLEADLVRGETKLSDLKPDESSTAESAMAAGPSTGTTRQRLKGGEAWDQEVSSKAEGLQFWKEFLEDRFIRGDDDEFDYAAVDGNEDLDVVARADAEDEWFDKEEPSWHEEVSGETGIQDF